MWQRSWPGKHRLNAFSVNVSHSHCIHVKPSFSVASKGPIFSGPLCIPGTDLVGNAPCAHCGGASVGSTNCLGRHRIYHLPSLVTGTVGWLTTPPLLPDGSPSLALLQRILATLNSYYGFFSHANTWQLRQHLYHHELGELRRYFLPDGPGYHHLRIRKAWLPLAHQQAAQQSVPRPGWVV